jgi:hypothetical protein
MQIDDLSNDPLGARLKAHFAAEDAGLDRLVPLAREAADARDTVGLSLQAQADLAAYDSSASAWKNARRPSRFGPLSLITGGFIAAAAALFFFVMRPNNDEPQAQLQAMGAHVFSLDVAVERGGQARTVKTGDTLKTGDRIGLFYTAHMPGHVHVLYVGAEIEVFLASKPIAEGQRVALPAGGEITAGQGCEYIVGFFSKTAIDANLARTAIEDARRDAQACTLSLRDGAQLGLGKVDVQVIGIRR